MGLNSTSPSTFTTGVLITDTENVSGGSNDSIVAEITPGAALDIQSTRGAFIGPRMTTAQRLALQASNGASVYDTTLNAMFFYQNGAWGNIVPGGDPNATYLVKTADASLPNAQVMGALPTGLVFNTTVTGVQSVIQTRIIDNEAGFKDTLFVGLTAGNNTNTGIGNCAVGTDTMQSLTSGQFNVSLGDGSLESLTSGNQNTSLGVNTLNQAINAQNNVAIGFESLAQITNSSSNVGVGQATFAFMTAGNFNTACGFAAGTSFANFTDCTFLGSQANSDASGYINATAIGANAVVGASNSLVLGNNAKVGIGTSTPSETLEVASATSSIFCNGGFRAHYVSSATSYTMNPNDFIIAITNTSAPRTVTLTTAATAKAGYIVYVKDESFNASANNITVNVSGGGNIDNGTTYNINTNAGAVALYSNGTRWLTFSTNI